MDRRKLLKGLNFWPPYLGAGIRVTEIAPDYRRVCVEMRLRFWNKNYVGTHYGGSLYSMCDPFFMLILIENLGRDYIVWDKAASIRFKKPGKGRVRAEFSISNETIDEIKKTLQNGGKMERNFLAQVIDEQGDCVAEVDKLLYIRRK